MKATHAFSYGHEAPLGKHRVLHRAYESSLRHVRDCQKRISITGKVLVQEKELFAGGKADGCIVGIDRHHVRPIVGGKETKPFESGAKVNNIQTDEIPFIGRIPSMAFNGHMPEGLCGRLMNVRIRCVAADSIYADNANRKSCTRHGISASFARKGGGKGRTVGKVSGSELSRERATRLKAASTPKSNITRFKEKKARDRKMEVLWIFFGVQKKTQ